MTPHELAVFYMGLLHTRTDIPPTELMERIERLLGYADSSSASDGVPSDVSSRSTQAAKRVLGSTVITETGAHVKYHDGTEKRLERQPWGSTGYTQNPSPASSLPVSPPLQLQPSKTTRTRAPRAGTPLHGLMDAVASVLQQADGPLTNAEIRLRLAEQSSLDPTTQQVSVVLHNLRQKGRATSVGSRNHDMRWFTDEAPSPEPFTTTLTLLPSG